MLSVLLTPIFLFYETLPVVRLESMLSEEFPQNNHWPFFFALHLLLFLHTTESVRPHSDTVPLVSCDSPLACGKEKCWPLAQEHAHSRSSERTAWFHVKGASFS